MSKKSEQSQQSVPQDRLDLESSFDNMGLDDRLIRAIDLMGWKNPSLIQSAAIPLALKGKDIVAQARTGSGKTAAYAIPILQMLLTSVFWTIFGNFRADISILETLKRSGCCGAGSYWRFDSSSRRCFQEVGPFLPADYYVCIDLR